jgi:hypothetical protein
LAYNGIAATTATARHAAHGVATMLARANKIDNAMMLNYLAACLSTHHLRKINAAVTRILRPKQQPQLTWNLELPQALPKLPMRQFFTIALPHCTALIRL